MSQRPCETREQRFERLLAEHGRALSRLAAAYVDDPRDREDLMQDIAFALWRALPAFRGECSERTFLFRIGHNRAISHRAGVRVRTQSLAPVDDVEIEDPGDDVSDRLIAAERYADLMVAVQRLTPALRETMVLSLEDMSHAEIAEVLGTTARTVAVRLTRARVALAQMLRQREGAIESTT
jgi:RNA polymerase sigma factor (sigma-70 family)